MARIKITVFTVLIWSGLVFTKILFEVNSGASLNANINSYEELFQSRMIGIGGDTFEFLLPAFGIYTYGDQYVVFHGNLYEWCRRPYLSSAVFSLFIFIFKSSFPIYFIAFFTLASSVSFALLLYEFNQKSFFLKALISIIAGFLAYQYISRLETSGIIFFLLCLLVISLLKGIKRPKIFYIISTIIILLLSLIRIEMILLLLIFSIYIYRSAYKRLSIIPLFVLLIIGPYLIIKNNYCFDSGGFWIWTYRNILIYEIRNSNDGQINLKDIKEVKHTLGEEARKHCPPFNNSNIKNSDYYNFIIGHVYPYQNYIHRSFKDKTIQYLKDNVYEVLPFILYRIALKNPYMLIFSTPDRDLLNLHFQIPNHVLFLSIFYVFSLAFLISLLFLIFKSDKEIRIILFSYLILLILYSIYFPFGGINGGRIRCFLLPFEAPLILFFLQTLKKESLNSKSALLKMIHFIRK